MASVAPVLYISSLKLPMQAHAQRCPDTRHLQSARPRHRCAGAVHFDQEPRTEGHAPLGCKRQPRLAPAVLPHCSHPSSAPAHTPHDEHTRLLTHPSNIPPHIKVARTISPATHHTPGTRTCSHMHTHTRSASLTLMAKKLSLASHATARASSVLLQPGGPYSRMPRGACAPTRARAPGTRNGHSTASRSLRAHDHAAAMN